MAKRLYRSKNNRMLAGVCAGIGDYFSIDPTIVRIIAVICLCAFNFAAFLAYIILAIVVPVENSAGINHSE